jgi:hypothetical protein
MPAPTSTPPVMSHRNVSEARASENVPVRAAAIAKRKHTPCCSDESATNSLSSNALSCQVVVDPSPRRLHRTMRRTHGPAREPSGPGRALAPAGSVWVERTVTVGPPRSVRMPSLLVSTPKRRSTSSAREPRARTFCEFGMTRPIIRLSRQDAACTKGGNEAGVQAFTGTPDYGHVPRNGHFADWRARLDSNQRPAASEAATLSI